MNSQNNGVGLGVLMVDFNPIVREGLTAVLEKDDKVEIVGKVKDGEEALKHIKNALRRGQPVHVVLTETRNDRLDGVQVTRMIKDEFPEIGVLVLTDDINDTYVIDAINAGANGYMFLKDTSPEALINSICRMGEGGSQIDSNLLRTAVDNLIQNGRRTLAERTAEAAHLTAREVDVLRLLGNGDSNKTISAILNISLDTTKKHIRNIIDKLHARTRTRAAIIAAQAGIVGKPLTNDIDHD